MHTNALIEEKSPYLRQHAHNPVDWLPWGERAFEKAKREDKPIFLSIGYSTCHWCHVMAHESFEDEAIASVLNQDFVPIKIDREERPDVDSIYMLFVQASTGSGGWPMSVWLTPDRKPFFGGTYFPPDSRYGRPGFADLLRHLGNAWKNERSKIEESGDAVLGQLRTITASAQPVEELQRPLFDAAFWQFRRSFDSTWGGFGTDPKFPRPSVLNYLLRFHHMDNNSEALDMVVRTLGQMARGGMHDQLGGGFHRYSVDERWFVPHFEKMLYDQAQLAIAYLEAYQVTADSFLADVARDIFNYVLRDMRSEDGAFYSAEDADSPDPEDPAHSGEGSFYIWRQSEIESLLEPRQATALTCNLGVQADGNVEHDPQGEFSGRNILFQARPVTECASRLQLPVQETEKLLSEAKGTLFSARSKRPRPHLDNKVLTSWNALMISALAKGFAVLSAPEYLKAAEEAMSFLLTAMQGRADGAILRRYCEGEAAIDGLLDDYAFLTQACLDLFEASGKAVYLTEANRFAEKVLAFADGQGGGFFSSAFEAPELVLRMKEEYDGAEPSGNSVATDVLLRLAHLTGNERYRSSAEMSLKSIASKLKAQPTMAPQMLVALARWLGGTQQVVVRCHEMTDNVNALLDEHRKVFLPDTAIFALTDQAAAALKPLAPFLSTLGRKGRFTVFRCRNFACEIPQVIE